MANNNNNNNNNNNKNYNLDLTLGLFPIDTTNNPLSTSNRDKREGELKRDLKRKLGSNLALTNQHCQGQNGHFVVENTCSVSTATNNSENDEDDNYCSNSAPGGSSSDTSSHSSHLPADVSAATSLQQKATPNLSHTQLYTSTSSQKNRFPHLRPPSKSPKCATPTNTNITYQSIELPSISNRKITSHKSTPLPQIPHVIGMNSDSRPIGEVVTAKPSSSNGHITSQESASLSKMPCVTTTGNGPKGKTITGFLYKYTKTEVSLVCVCHGTSFSPAGFVEHAGGVDIEHPLKHIKVVPFPLS